MEINVNSHFVEADEPESLSDSSSLPKPVVGDGDGPSLIQFFMIELPICGFSLLVVYTIISAIWAALQ